MQRPPLVRHLPSWFLYGFLWLIAQLPLPVHFWIGRGLGHVVRWLGIRRHVIEKNIKQCFPQLDHAQQIKLIHQNYCETGIMVMQTLKTFLGLSDSVFNQIKIEGSNHLEKNLKHKKGVLLVSAHFTALDVGGKIICQHYPISGVYRPHKNAVMEYIVKRSRLNYAENMFSRDQLRDIVKHLKSGGIIWYAPDQDYRRGRSIFSPFFNTPASTITATHQLARMTDCSIIFFSVKRMAKKPYYQLHLSKPLSAFPSDEQTDTDTINHGIENMIKKTPEQYLWLHKRFKTTPDKIDFYQHS